MVSNLYAYKVFSNIKDKQAIQLKAMNKKKLTIIEDKERRITCIRLFMYVTAEQLQCIIRDKRIKVSCPWKTNDITEGLFQSEVRQCEYIKEYGYVCFSATCTSPAMWGYYAGRSTGACLFFDFPLGHDGVKDDLYILRDNIIEALNRYLLREVKYEKNRVKRIDCTREIDALFSKDTDWSHEEEFRLLIRLEDIFWENNTDDGDAFYSGFLFSYLKGIILGANFQEEKPVFKCRLSSKLSYIFVTKAQISRTRYQHDIDEKNFPPLVYPEEHTLILDEFEPSDAKNIEIGNMDFPCNKKSLKFYKRKKDPYLYALAKHKGNRYNLYRIIDNRRDVMSNIKRETLSILYKK